MKGREALEKATDIIQPTVGWRDVEAYLRRAIDLNEFEQGGQIPTEAELMRRLGASRYAVRRAMTRLQEDGLIRVEQGRGSFVHDDYLVSYRITNRARFTNLLIANQITPGQEILRIETRQASEEAREFLELSRNSRVLFMELLGYADGLIVKHDSNFFPLPRFEGFEEYLRRTHSVTEALLAFGVNDCRRKSTSVVGRLPTPAEARQLRQLPSQPIFECQRVDTDEDGRPIIFGVTKFNCERVRLVV